MFFFTHAPSGGGRECFFLRTPKVGAAVHVFFSRAYAKNHFSHFYFGRHPVRGPVNVFFFAASPKSGKFLDFPAKTTGNFDDFFGISVVVARPAVNVFFSHFGGSRRLRPAVHVFFFAAICEK